MLDCTVLDISPFGAKLTSSESLDLEQPIRLKVTEGGEFAGRVVWCRDGLIGLRFEFFDHEPNRMAVSGRLRPSRDPRE